MPMASSKIPQSGPDGRPSFLTDERQARIIEAVKTGAGWKTVAQYAGISDITLYEWRRRGRRYQAMLEGGDGVADLKAHRIWRKADAAWEAGDRQRAYAHLAALDAHTDLSREIPFYKLVLALDAAEAETAVVMAKIVLRAAATDRPDLALKWLERRRPEDWAPTRVIVTDADADFETRKDQALARLEELRQARTGGNGQA